MTIQKKRCAWVGEGDRLMEEYPDREWGVPPYFIPVFCKTLT